MIGFEGGILRTYGVDDLVDGGEVKRQKGLV